MKTPQSQDLFSFTSRARAMGAIDAALWIAALVVVVSSAIWTKSYGTSETMPALAGMTQIPVSIDNSRSSVEPIIEQTEEVLDSEPLEQEEPAEAIPTSYRWFDGKLVRPARVIYMTVTGYSPDARSCGEFADGKTATMYSVWTNGMKLVAADPKVLPYWSLVSIPGYADAQVVPVLDCGGAIKGNRLDLLYPTHEMARQWGVRQMPVTVWEYVDEE